MNLIPYIQLSSKIEANGSHHKGLSPCSVKCVHVGGIEATHRPSLCPLCSECRSNRQVLLSHAVLYPCFSRCLCFSPSASRASLVLENWFDRAAVWFVKNSGVSGVSFLRILQINHYKTELFQLNFTPT